jgi:predicted O-methyltransferase YrrM
MPFDSSRLRTLTEADLRAIFTSEAIASDFNRDKELLGKLGLPEYSGGINPGDQRAIYSLIRALEPESVLEVGTHIGCSTVHIALALKGIVKPNVSRHPEITTVDIRDVNDSTTKPWLNYNSSNSPRELVEKVGCGGLVSFVKADALDFLSTCKQQFDFIFLDGLHTAKRVYQEIPLALALLKEGGTILLHDFFPNNQPLWSDGEVCQGPYMATQRLLKEGAGFTVCPLGTLPWATKLGSSKTSLAILSRSTK